MAIEFDAKAHDGTCTSITNTWNHTCSGNQRLLVVGAFSNDGSANATIADVTYNAVSLTLLKHQDISVADTFFIELWYLINPASGSNEVKITRDGGSGGIYSGLSLSFKNVVQTSPMEANNGANGQAVNGTPAPSVSVTTVTDNAWVVDLVITAVLTSLAAHASQTSREVYNCSTNSFGSSTEGPKTPAGAVSMDWTVGGGSISWGIIGAAIKPAKETGGALLPHLVNEF